MPAPSPGTIFTVIGNIVAKSETFAFEAPGTFTSVGIVAGVGLPAAGATVLVTIAMQGLSEDLVGSVEVVSVVDSRGNTYTPIADTDFDLISITYPPPPLAETGESRVLGVWASYIDTNIHNGDTITVTYSNPTSSAMTDLRSMFLADGYTGLLKNVLMVTDPYTWVDDAADPADPFTSPTFTGRTLSYQNIFGHKVAVTTPNQQFKWAVFAINNYLGFAPCYFGTTPEPPASCNFDYVTITAQNVWTDLLKKSQIGTTSPLAGTDGSLVEANYARIGLTSIHGNATTTLIEPGMHQSGSPSGFDFKDMTNTYKGGRMFVLETTQGDPVTHALDGLAFRVA